MKRTTLVIIAGLAMAAGIVHAGYTVVAPDGEIVDNAATVAASGSVWVQMGIGAPLELVADEEGVVRLPELQQAQYVVLDAESGEPVEGGSLTWKVPDSPEEFTVASWQSAKGHLDFPCRSGERYVLSAPGYASATGLVVADGRRLSVLLAPQGDLTVKLEPASEARFWLTREDRINVTNLFTNVADQHTIDAGGMLTVRELDRDANYVGLVVAQGKTPVMDLFQGLPQDRDLMLDDGLTVHGTVRDLEGNPLVGARLEAMGIITELDSFRYRQYATADAEGAFSVSGLLPGEIRVRACADDRACAETKVEISPDVVVDPVAFELAAGRTVVMVVKDEINTPIVKALVYFQDRLHNTDRRGELEIQGVAYGSSFPVKIFGDGFGMWEGTFTADRDRVVIVVPGGGVLEQQVLSAQRFEEDEVIVRWQAYTSEGRETKGGTGSWDPEHGIARVTGLETGIYALKIRLPGSATLVSERVEVSVGEEVVLAPAMPDRGLAIAGRILDGETYQPIAGAQVSCEPGSPSVFRAPHVVQEVPSILTDTEGMFLLEGLDPGTCRAMVRASGYATWRLENVEPDDLGFDIGDVEMDAGMTIVGQVYDRTDRPITGAVVEIAEAASYAYFAETTIRTDHDGYFRAERLPVGRWNVTAKYGGEKTRETVMGEANETVEANLMLGGTSIEGEIWLGDNRAAGGTLVLTTNGAQAPGVVVMMQRLTADRQIFGVDNEPVQFSVAADGRFAGRGLQPGRYFASYTPPEGGSAPVTKPLDVPQVESFQCAIQYANSTVEGFVVDTSGEPVSGASVVATAGDGIQEISAFTNGEGRFSVQGLEPGRAVLTASHSEFASSNPSEFDLRDGYSEGPVVLELLPQDGANIFLTVNALAGSAGGAPVYLVGPETSTGFTDGGGLASFSGITAGSYRPCGFAYGGATGCGENLSVDDGDRLQASLELGRGGYVDVYLSTAKSAVAGTTKRGPSVRVMTTDGVDISSLLLMASPPQATAGGMRIGPLQSDDYVISVTTEAGPRQGTVSVYEGDASELDLR